MCSQAPAAGWNAAQPLALIGRQSLLGSKPMHVHIVMDRQGDTRFAYDRANARSLADAERRFRELTGKGFRAVALGKDGQPGRLMRSFDAEAEQTLFIPQLQGG